MEYNQQAACHKMYRSEQQSSFLNLALSLLLEFIQISYTLSAYTTNFFHHMYVHVDIKKILNKNKNTFEKVVDM